MELKGLLAFFLVIQLLSTIALSRTHDHPALSSSIDDSLSSDVENKCVFTLYVRTSNIIAGGTDSIISVTFYDDDGNGVVIKDLEKWGGVMGQGHDYYERGNLDIFTGRGPCLDKPVCSMKLTSDGSGHSWYCNYVEVTTTGPHMKCAQQLFTVEQYLSEHLPPFELTAVRDKCSNSTTGFKRDPSKLVSDDHILLAASASASG